MHRHPTVPALLLILLVVAAPPADAVERPFHLTAIGTVVDGTIHATGTATHLGQFTESGTPVLTPDPDDPNRLLISGTLSFIGANGDALQGVTSAVMDLTTGIAPGTFQVLGGTGRFAAASGEIGFVIMQDLTTGEFKTVGLGTIDF